MTSVPQQQVATGKTTDRSDSTPKVVAVGFGVLCLSYMLNAMDRQIFHPLLPDISGEFGFSLEQGGTLATGFTLGLAAAGLLGGFLVGRRTVAADAAARPRYRGTGRGAHVPDAHALWLSGEVTTPTCKGWRGRT